MCPCTQREGEKEGERKRGRFISLSRNWILGNIILIVCLLFFPVYKIKISNKVSVVVKTFLKNEANCCTCFHFCMTA